MKRVGCIILAMIVLLTVSACNESNVKSTATNTTPATAAATPSLTVEPTQTQTATAVQTKEPTPVPTDMPTPSPTPAATTPTPQPTAFAPATALADKIMKEKKWAAYKYAGTVREAVAIVLANSTVYTPEQVAAKLRKNVNKIVIARKIPSWGYDPARKTISLDTASGTVEALTYVLTSSISGFSEYQKYPWGKIKGVPWCFGSNKSVKLGKHESSFRLMGGLTDFISSRNTPGTVIANAGSPFNDTMASVQYYSDGNRGLPLEQGLAILFYYASGSREAETAFFGNRKASDAYRAAFTKRFGAKKLDSLVTMADAVGMYFGYTHLFSSTQQKDGLAKMKAYEDALLGLLETRLAGIKTQTELDQFLSDLEQFDRFNLRIEEESYMKSVSDRIGKIKEAAITTTIP